jgi:hypothetical protein
MLKFEELPKDGVAFEQLVRELLLRELFQVAWTGVGPDGGRDLVVTERSSGPIADFERRWIVSCKHFANGGGAVGLNDLDRSVVDSCRSAQAAGFILACSTHPSSSLVTRLKEIEINNAILCRSWDSVELERRLMTPRTFALVHAFLPASAASLPWAVYNAGSPSFWCGVHKGHFFYLASRIASGTPPLADVEAIIAKIDAVPLVARDQFGHGERLRLRAVYFDNKHENYYVFVDYLVPTSAPGKKPFSQSLTRSSVLSLLDDGACLHVDAAGGSCPTSWDVLRIVTSQFSDRFEQDASEYYERYMPNFKSGQAREGSAPSHGWDSSSWK